MKNLKIGEIDYRQLMILIFVLVIAIDLLFIKYIFPPVRIKRDNLLKDCRRYESSIKSKIESVKRREIVFRKIVETKEKIKILENNLTLLKSKKVSVLDVGKMLKSLFLQSGINVVSFNVLGIKKEKYRVIYEFSLVVDDSLRNIVYFLDRVESYSQNMQIPQYDLKVKNGMYEARIKIEYVQVNIQ